MLLVLKILAELGDHLQRFAFIGKDRHVFKGFLRRKSGYRWMVKTYENKIGTFGAWIFGVR